jgi:hypothetical protein
MLSRDLGEAMQMSRRQARSFTILLALAVALVAGACGQDQGGSAAATTSTPDAGAVQKQSARTSAPVRDKSVMVRVSKCGFYPAGELSFFGGSVELMTKHGGITNKGKLRPTLPGSWWCLHGALLVDDGEVPLGALLAPDSPLAVHVSIPGVQWLPEKRREISFSPSDPEPPPGRGVSLVSVFLSNSAYEKTLSKISMKTISGIPAEIQDACERSREVRGDPEDERARVMEHQKVYLDHGSLSEPGNTLAMTLDLLHEKCDATP